MVRSSAAEYLTVVAASGDSKASVEMRYEDENIWLTQRMMAKLYHVSVPANNQHLKRIFSDNELESAATVKQYSTVQTEGNRQVQRSVEHYRLTAIIAVGLKIENELTQEATAKEYIAVQTVGNHQVQRSIVQDRLFESDFDRLLKQLAHEGDKP